MRSREGVRRVGWLGRLARRILPIGVAIGLLTVGVSPALAGSTSLGRIAMLNANGSFNSAFASGSGSGFNGTVFAMAYQADGNLVVGGNFTSYNGVAVGRIARVSPAGVLDTSFNTAVGAGFNSAVYGLAIQPDGSILASGNFTNYKGQSAIRLARLSAAGALDTAFNTAMGTGFGSYVYAIGLLSDNSIVAAGAFTSFNGTSAIRIAHLSSAGVFDTSFNTNIGFGPNSTVWSLVVQSGDHILLGGTFAAYNSALAGRLVRLSSTGVLDTTFASNIGAGLNNYVYSLAQQSDGSVVIGGAFTTIKGATSNRVARISALGVPDTAFTAQLGTGFDTDVNAVAVTPAGNIMVGGYFTTLNGTSDTYLARLSSTGAPDTAFLSNLGGGLNNAVVSFAVPPVGTTVMVGGWFSTLTTPSVVTFNANGGSGTMAAQSSLTATTLTPNAFTRGGFTFAGWNTAANGSGTSYANSASFPFTADTALYAQWTASSFAVTYALEVAPIGGCVRGVEVTRARGLLTTVV